MMSNVQALRQQIRNGSITSHTSGLAKGLVQANIAILPYEYAFEFMRFCLHNPKPCPLLAVSTPGEIDFPTLGQNIDIRHDVPRYLLVQDGQTEEVTDIAAVWRDDLVSFAIGCSFSFEQPLLDAGIVLRHVQEKRNVAMYESNLPLQTCGIFAGNMVVSMRPMSANDVIKATQITAKMPCVHGAPVHIGNPQAIGIADIQNPDFGEAVSIAENELPVFWACGVTPFLALQRSGIPFFITHFPGHMLITDIKNDELFT